MLWTVHLLSFTRQSKLNLKPAASREAMNTKSGSGMSMPSLPTTEVVLHMQTLKTYSGCPFLTTDQF